MNFMTIEICNNRLEAEARKDIIKAQAPGANWNSRIVEDISIVTAFLTPDLAEDPAALEPIFTPATGAPAAPAAVLFIWTED